MSTKATLVILHKDYCEIIAVKHGRDLAEVWLSGDMSPKQMDALRDRAKELSKILFPDGTLYDYYYEVKDKDVVKELNSFGTEWISKTEDSEIVIFVKGTEDPVRYDLFIYRDLWAEDEEIDTDVRCLGC